MNNLIFIISVGHSPAPAGLEPGELGDLRMKLLRFLEESKFCTVERFATYMMNKGETIFCLYQILASVFSFSLHSSNLLQLC